MKAEQMGSNHSHLAKPVARHTDGPPVLLFAGEATHDHYYSTVHGAIETGWREAHRIGSYYSSSEKKQEVDMPLPTPQSFDVVIIGSGLAGLGAAYALKDSDTKFIVLEAQDYVGGRVKSKEMQNLRYDCTLPKIQGLVDVGAQWLHGEQNSLHNIASKNDLLLNEVSEEGLGSYVREDGYVFDDLFRKKIDFEIGKILTECEKFASNNAKDYPKSVEHYLEKEFRRYIETLTTDEEKKLAWQVYDWHKRFQIIDNSCLSLDQVSAKYWGMYSFNGESCQAHINFKTGFTSLVDAIVKEIGVKNIQLNTEIVEINWDVLQRDDKLVSIRTFGGQTYLAKNVIVTCSLGVLKQNHKQLFRPNLPERTEVAIDQIGFETINKIFLQFDEPWWQPMEGIQLIYNSETDYTNSKWTRYISGFDILSPGSPNTLIGWVGSHGALEMEKLSFIQIIDDCLALLRTFTRKNVPYPIRFAYSQWGSNEFVRGGYSYLSTKCDKTGFNGTTLSTPITIDDLPSKSMAITNGINTSSMNGSMTNGTSTDNMEKQSDSDTKPSETIKLEASNTNIKRPIILFAGEACHPKYFSTAHGAFLSGIEQAQTILKNA